jgi:hypothetical protein
MERLQARGAGAFDRHLTVRSGVKSRQILPLTVIDQAWM